MKRKFVGIVAASSAIAFAIGAAAVGFSAQAAEPPRVEATAETTTTTTPAPTAAPTATPTAQTAAAIDPMSAEYNSYADPNSVDYVSPDMKAAWFAKDAVIRKCMVDKSLDYIVAPYWLGGSPEPAGLSFNDSHTWLLAYYGDNHPAWSELPEERGCSGLGQLIDEGKLDAPPVPVPADPVDLPTDRQQWLIHQDVVRACMAEKGFDYLYFEWWNPVYQPTFDPNNPTPQGPAAMPQNLNAEQAAAWNFALDGDTGGGADYNWEDAGCWGYAAHVQGTTH